MLFLFLPINSVLISVLLNALAPVDLLPRKAPVLEKEGKSRKEIVYTADTAQKALFWGKRSSHVHTVTPNTNHS